MIPVWRICARRHAKRAFSGEGARLYGGRWNPRGIAVVYTSATLSLAALELFVHLDPDELPANLVAVEARIPADVPIRHLPAEELGRSWRRYPAPASLQDLGAEWVAAGETAALCVPSAVIPLERNYLLNPAHAQFARIEIQPARPFLFDPRMRRR